nr:N-acetylgalactosamine-6-O-sulfatase-like [Nerophis lumbriciformis]
MLTGIYGFRYEVHILPPNAPMKIKPEMFTLPQMFKQAGYSTAVIGKWHLGIGDGKTKVDWNGEVKPGPLEVGFDYSFLLPSTNDRVPCVYLENHRVVNLDPEDPLYVGKVPEGHTSTVYPDGKKDRAAMTYYQSSVGHNYSVINGIGRIGYMWGGKLALWDDETMADEFVKQAQKYLEGRKKDEPFFLYWSATDIHVPRTPHPRFRGKSELSYRGDAMVQLDWCVGEIMKALEKNGLAENTLVIFSSDNGPVYDDGYVDGTTVMTSTKESDRGHDGSGIYSGGKYQIYEGGTRVPFIVSWPEKIKAGQTSAALVNQVDFLASFAKLVGVELAENEGIDSRDHLKVLLGEDEKGLANTIVEAQSHLALREGNWKFIPAVKRRRHNKQPGIDGLYDLTTDPGETKNVIEDHKEQAAKMKATLEKFRGAEGVRRLAK